LATLGDTKAIVLLVNAGAELSAINNKGNTPLHEAVMCRQTAAAKVLIELGASHKIANIAGQTPQDIARSDNYTPTIELLEQC
jgi:ankyrin repeat protein